MHLQVSSVIALYIMVCVCMLCSLTGAILVVGGLYMLLWGKSKETARQESDFDSKNSPDKYDSINITNSSLVSNQKECDMKIAASVAPDTSLNVDNTLGEAQQLNI